MESTSLCNSLIGYSVEWRCCSLVFTKSGFNHPSIIESPLGLRALIEKGEIASKLIKQSDKHIDQFLHVCIVFSESFSSKKSFHDRSYLCQFFGDQRTIGIETADSFIEDHILIIRIALSKNTCCMYGTC
jgi:hypothetical protein